MQSLYDLTRPNNPVPMPDVAAQLAAIQAEASRLSWALHNANREQRHARTQAERRAADEALAEATRNAQQWLALVPLKGIGDEPAEPVGEAA